MAKASAAAKTAAKATNKPTNQKGTKLTDPLADLGLEPSVPTAGTAPTVAAAETAKAERTEVEVGEIETGFVDFIPQSKRSSGGSKYPFDTLVAPAKGADGKVKYANFIVRVQTGVEPDALKRSVQSATTQANKHGKPQGKYFITRAIPATADKAEGIQVIRTDDIPAKG